jgi:hypothetical protein
MGQSGQAGVRGKNCGKTDDVDNFKYEDRKYLESLMDYFSFLCEVF